MMAERSSSVSQWSRGTSALCSLAFPYRFFNHRTFRAKIRSLKGFARSATRFALRTPERSPQPGRACPLVSRRPQVGPRLMQSEVLLGDVGDKLVLVCELGLERGDVLFELAFPARDGSRRCECRMRVGLKQQ
jgi:hypothetical protein